MTPASTATATAATRARRSDKSATGSKTYCLMPNHWHLILRPARDGELSDFMQWLTLTHTQRWKAHYHQVGSGHLYQGRFKSFPVQEDGHFLTVMRYVERNPLRAGLVKRAEDWRWGSLWHRQAGEGEMAERLCGWPVAEPEDWVGWVNAAPTDAELEGLRGCLKRGRPFGVADWTGATARRMGLEGTLRKRGRPPKSRAAKKGT